jgi:hypothetical protein
VNWQLRIRILDEEKDVAQAVAQGAANMLGRTVELLREDFKETVYVETFKPKAK